MLPWKRKVSNLLYFSRKVTQSCYKYYFWVEFLDGGKWKQHFLVLFSGNWCSLWISRGHWYFLSNEEKEFFIIHSLEKLKLLHSGTYMSTSTPHVTLKSPLLLQFCNNKIKEMITNPRNSWLQIFLVSTLVNVWILMLGCNGFISLK